ncbi:hypothetical protein CROQUDRAFT_133674 [Cronartium quercuum f. sp. fusiforme G11]|uniref:ATP synthase complex subunit H-domain-containing protein n=1 Tax=Cronartium quercuum f. sp. fusiforme G11 TaxID=708437 RepID=A0A9P6NH99_9BASI|nr:hypothetical protein CROQUDRAFT_133674 [Cronartium quercuum f. sp. fusiforme G11]
MSNLTRQTARIARSLSLAVVPSQRSFTTSFQTKKDFVQELYLRELKSYKPSPSISGVQTQVREFTMPPTPPAPYLPTAQDVAQELESWDKASLVNTSTINTQSYGSIEVDSTQSADEYLSFLERDHPTPTTAHH